MRMNKIPRHRPRLARPPRRRPRARLWLAAAPLAACLTAGCAPAAAPSGPAAATPAAAGPLNCAKPGYRACYSPREYQVAYGVAPLLRLGIDGRGETVAIFTVASTPSDPDTGDIRKDLAAFDARFGLPQARLNVVNTIAKSPAPYLAGAEERGDAEIVHALAPGATLDFILVPDITSSYANSAARGAAAFTQAVRESAALHAAVLSISATGGESLFTRGEAAAMNQALEQARQQHVTVVASSGDEGAISTAGPPVQVSLPASDPLVLSVGGTRLDASWVTGAYHGETAWNPGDEASGGGYSSLFTRPAYQDGLARARATRGVPDVAANADPATGMAVLQADGALHSSRGTSASAPLWAAVIALADQEAGQHLGFINPAIYAIARSPAYHQAFHDVTTGDNSVQWHGSVITGYHAGPGWDPVTGWGSPNAQYLVPLLASTARSAP